MTTRPSAASMTRSSTHLEKRPQRLAFQELPNGAVGDRLSEHRKDLLIGGGQTLDVVLAVGIAHVVGAEREKSALYQLLYPQRLDLERRNAVRILEQQEGPGRISGDGQEISDPMAADELADPLHERRSARPHGGCNRLAHELVHGGLGGRER